MVHRRHLNNRDARRQRMALAKNGLRARILVCDYRKAADFVHGHADCYDCEMEIYLRERAAEFDTPSA